MEAPHCFASSNSRGKTRASERSPNTTTSARIAPLVEDLGKECEKLKSISTEQNMDLAKLRDDLRDLRHDQCAKMRCLFVATRHKDL